MTIPGRACLPPLCLLALLAAACGGPDPEPVAAASTAATRGASLAASPNPVLEGATFHLAGCGFAASLPVTLTDTAPGGSTTSFGGVADASGCLAVDHAAGYAPGAHTVAATQLLKRNQSTLVAQASLSVSPAPLAATSEQYTFRWDATKGCVSEDDALSWSAAGYLAPGQSYTFTPRYPDCNDPRAVMVHVAAETGASLRISTVVPAADGNSNDPGQAGMAIHADTRSGVAQLCMFPNTSGIGSAGYAITITNVGTTTANAITVSGKDTNDWPYYYWADCLAADADHDGWSDSLEHAMAQLVYPTGNYLYGATPAGSNYLRSCGTPQANDEFDFWPPDLDDDGVVTQADVALVSAHVGEGNGIPWSAITPDPNLPQSFWSHVGAWNRFDLNADGVVDAKDVAIVQGLLGARCAP
ncbi:dockerin type I domain-containing protein [Anaeromyxobacter paludicola]|nr:dockerin type I domain-containing protein [Anaeromyxobacter paludicola]